MPYHHPEEQNACVHQVVAAVDTSSSSGVRGLTVYRNRHPLNQSTSVLSRWFPLVLTRYPVRVTRPLAFSRAANPCCPARVFLVRPFASLVFDQHYRLNELLSFHCNQPVRLQWLHTSRALTL